MPRMKLIPQKTLPDVVTPRMWARRFRTFIRDPDATFGDFLAGFLALWEEAKDYVTDYEASECLINQLPSCWRLSAESHMAELLFKDSITGALRCDFPTLLQRLFEQWTMYGNPPSSLQQRAELSRGEVLGKVWSTTKDMSVLQSRKTGIEVTPSSKITLQKTVSSNDLVQMRRTRELARKRAHDEGVSSAVDAPAWKGGDEHPLLIHGDEDHAED